MSTAPESFQNEIQGRRVHQIRSPIVPAHSDTFFVLLTTLHVIQCDQEYVRLRISICSYFILYQKYWRMQRLICTPYLGENVTTNSFRVNTTVADAYTLLAVSV